MSGLSRRGFGLALAAALASPALAGAPAGTQVWRVGRVKISRIEESSAPFGMRPGTFIPDAKPETVTGLAWLRPDFADETGAVPFATNGYVVDTGARRILVDAGSGEGKSKATGRASTATSHFMQNLAAAGYAPETIDTVVCTHLHADHVGWFTHKVDGVWKPTFPKARYRVSKGEFDYWKAQTENANERLSFVENIQPVVDAGLLETVTATYEAAPGVRFVPTPGHTPGHVSVRIASAGAEALITGDFVHFLVEFAHPDWRYPSDYDPSQATRTRQAEYAALADGRVLVIGTHFPYPTAGRLVREGGGYRFQAQP